MTTFPAQRIVERVEWLTADNQQLRTALTAVRRQLWAECEEACPWRLTALGLADEVARLRGELAAVEARLTRHSLTWEPA